MKFTLSWLKEHLETTASLEEICTTLTNIGLELEGVTDPAALFAPFKVALIEKAERHPNADRLKVCIVDTGAGKTQVVCGAPNARTGMKGVFAPDGSYIPGTDITLKKGVIRGEESNGMMVSEREMGLSDDHDGIIEVADDIALGTPFADLYNLNDPVIEISVTPNRADCAGVRGIARDLAAAGIGTLKSLPDVKVESVFKNPVKVHLDAGDACPNFLGRYIKGVKNGPSPDWLQQRLKAIGLRPISALVDITNFFTIGYDRPLHVFDADRLQGDIRVKLSKGGETLEALNDKTYTLGEGMTAVCDDSGVLGLGGIVGGTSTGVEDDTVNVYLEAAYFDPMRTARTGRALQVISDARYRFERGIDPSFTAQGVELATAMILDLCGGEASDVYEAGTAPDLTKTIEFDCALTKKLTGCDIPEPRQIDILERLGFTVQKGKPLKVTVPSWRGDIMGKADLVEEVIRIEGLDKIEAVSVRKDTPVTTPAETQMYARARKSRIALAAAGLNECVTWSFIPRAYADLFGANDNPAANLLTLKNPVNAEMDQMRSNLLPNLLQAAQRNADKTLPNAALFEVGPVFLTSKADGQRIVAAGIRTGEAVSRHWAGGARPVDLYDAKADAIAALEACGAPVDNLQIRRDAPGWYHPGRSGVFALGKNVLAAFGELHPAALEKLDIDGPAVGFEVFLEAIPEPRKKEGAARPQLNMNALQPVARDFAFLVDRNVEADDIIRAVKSAEKKMIASVDVFDVYIGKGVDEDKKSVAVSVVLQPEDKSFTEDELDSLGKRITDSVLSRTGGVLRG